MSRTCPADYRYRPEALQRPPELEAETLYVIGGLYGNVEALAAIEALREREAQGGRPVTLVFNGDFHWFDVAPDAHARIGTTVRTHTALRGNVEAELARLAHRPGPGPGAADGDADEAAGAGGAMDCGCAYPDYVEPGVVERSDAIIARLAATARDFPALLAHLGTLPMHLVARVGGRRIAILHGDPEALAGWQLAAEALAGLDAPDGAGPPGVPQTPRARIEAWFRRAGADAFATTHTCLPFARDFAVDGRPRVLINNGAAGMPNFRGLRCGLLTRISARPEVPADSLYGLAAGGVRYDALPIPYDPARWLRRFAADWPPGSPAHASYHARLADGPAWTLADAIRGSVRPVARPGRTRRTA